MTYQIAENFISINGEGRRSGELAIFIRFAGCNLQCTYCDTAWAQDAKSAIEYFTKEEIYSYIKKNNITNVTLTGGEPLHQNGIQELVDFLLLDENIRIEIETNGSIEISKVCSHNRDRVSVTMDYKLPSSGMQSYMHEKNLRLIRKNDSVKFVIQDKKDFYSMLEVVKRYNLLERCTVLLSPVYGKCDSAFIIDEMKNNNLNGAKFQLQIHKYIWNPDMRGV